MAQEVAGRAGTRTGGADARDIARSSPNDHRLRQSPAYREQVRRLHQLGPRPVGELLGEIVAAVPDAAPILAERLNAYADLDPRLVDWLGGRDWLEPVAVLRVVGGRA